MREYRAVVHGHAIEVRVGDLGRERVLLDGRLVSHRPFAGWTNESHFIDITDEKGAVRRVEVRVVTPTKGLGLVQKVRISVDGMDRALVDPLSVNRRPSCCPNCGYNLAGLTPTNGEVKCPECGRHASASLIETQ